MFWWAYTLWCRNVVIFRHRVVFGSGLHVVVSKICNFQASGCVSVGLTRGGVKLVIFRHRVVFGSGLHVAVSKRGNFQALGCGWVGLTCGDVEKGNF